MLRQPHVPVPDVPGAGDAVLRDGAAQCGGGCGHGYGDLGAQANGNQVHCHPSTCHAPRVWGASSYPMGRAGEDRVAAERPFHHGSISLEGPVIRTVVLITLADVDDLGAAGGGARKEDRPPHTQPSLPRQLVHSKALRPLTVDGLPGGVCAQSARQPESRQVSPNRCQMAEHGGLSF